jgi:hypothetical protein
LSGVVIFAGTSGANLGTAGGAALGVCAWAAGDPIAIAAAKTMLDPIRFRVLISCWLLSLSK